MVDEDASDTALAAPETPSPDETPSSFGRGPWRRGRRLLVVGVVALLVVWGVLAVRAVTDARRDLTGAERDLRAGRDALADLDLAGADAALAAGDDRLRAAQQRLGSAALWPAYWLPLLGDDLAVARQLVASGREVTAAVQTVTAALQDLPSGLDSLLPRQGRVPLAPWQRLQPPLEAAAERLARARDAVAATPDDGLTGPVERGRARFLDLVGPAASQVDGLAVAAGVLPRLLGEDSPRRYFVAAANPAEARGVGGFMGAFAVLRVDRGILQVGGFRPIQDLEQLPSTQLPAPHPSLVGRYARYGGTGFFQNLNLTPDFPSAAAQIEALYAATEDVDLDGTILVDPFALSALLELSGPVEVAGIGRLDADGIADFVLNEAYEEITDSEERKALLGQVAAAALTRFLQQPTLDDPGRLLDRMASVFGGGHVLVHSRDPVVQEGLERLGVAGVFAVPDGDLVAVVLNDGSAAKLDYYLRRSLEYRVTLGRGGRATGDLTVRLRNDAPRAGVDAYVIGPNVDGLAAGEILTWISVYCARTCAFDTVPEDSARGTEPVRQRELGHPVASLWQTIPAGDSRELTYRWATSEAWTAEDGAWSYELTYRHQTTTEPVLLRIAVRLPPGFAAASVEPDGAVTDDTVLWELTADGDRQFRIVLRRAP